MNHLQHNVSSQTFKAQIAVGSWAHTPLMPSGFAEEVVKSRMGRDKGKGRAEKGSRSGCTDDVMELDLD